MPCLFFLYDNSNVCEWGILNQLMWWNIEGLRVRDSKEWNPTDAIHHLPAKALQSPQSLIHELKIVE